MVTYHIVEEELSNQDVGRYATYGICAYCSDSSGTREIAHYSDIFLNREEVEQFVNRCNTLGLSVIHLPEVIDDILNLS